MAQAIKTVEFPIGTLLTTLATATSLASSTENDFANVTVALPESSKTIRAAWIETVHNSAAPTTARRFDGARIGVQIDAVAFSDADVTGTGATATGDAYVVYADRDVTSYFVTNYTGTSHAIGVRVRFENDAADVVNNIAVKLYITYEYDDTSSTQVKTVKIPLEGITAFLTTSANTDMRGSASSGQIPLLDSWLVESSKSFKQIWFEVHATDGGGAATDFNVNYSIDAGATDARATLEKGLDCSCRFFDIAVMNSLVTSSAHDFEAWSSLASRFERLGAILHVTYEFAESSSSITNSLMIPIHSQAGALNGTTSGDQDTFSTEFYIEEPTTITMLQSGLIAHFCINASSNASIIASGEGVAGGAQTTHRTYTGTSLVHAGSRALIHRIDLAHGGTAVTLARGLNRLVLKAYSSTSGNLSCFSGFWIINYSSGKASAGIGAHNVTTQWPLATIFDGTIAATSTRDIATTNQKTPIIPQSNYYLNAVGHIMETNQSAGGYNNLLAERVSGDLETDGWENLVCFTPTTQAEYGWHTHVAAKCTWLRYPSQPVTEGKALNIESARKYRIYGNLTAQTALKVVITTHAITYSIAGTISGSAGGTVTINAYSTATGKKLATTSRSGNGSYSMTWYDNVSEVFTEAWESSSLLMRSDNLVAT
jgi:hypothetical protein